MTSIDLTLDAPARNRRGIARLHVGDTAGALDDFRRAALQSPDYPEAWNNAGLVRQMLGLLAPALTDFERALRLRPDYPEALSNRGRVRQALGDWTGALADYEQALTSAGDTGFAASVLHNRGTLWQQRGDPTRAMADFDQALAVDPAHAATYLARAGLRKDLGDLAGAVADFDRVLALNPPPGQAEAYHGRGGVRALRGDFAGAVEDYDRAVRLEPGRFQYYLSRAFARYHLRDRRGLEDFRTAFRLDADGAVGEVLRLLRADVRRDAAAVLANCRKHLRLDPHDAVALARRGLTLRLLGRDAEAAADVTALRNVSPDLGRFLQRLTTRAVNDDPARSSAAICQAGVSNARCNHPSNSTTLPAAI